MTAKKIEWVGKVVRKQGFLRIAVGLALKCKIKIIGRIILQINLVAGIVPTLLFLHF